MENRYPAPPKPLKLNVNKPKMNITLRKSINSASGQRFDMDINNTINNYEAKYGSKYELNFNIIITEMP